jgi:hypothetical protein
MARAHGAPQGGGTKPAFQKGKNHVGFWNPEVRTRLFLSNKIGRGSFTAVFFFQCMEAIGCKTVRLEDD